MEINKNIDYIILNEDLDGDISTEKIIEEIKKVNANIKVLLISNSSYDEKEIIKMLDERNEKKIENREYQDKNKSSVFKQKTLPINNLFTLENKEIRRKGETICILGPNGIGKSVFSILFSQSMQNKKSIIIDFDILNESLHTLLGIKNYKEKIKKKIKQNDLINHNQNYKDYIIKNNSKIDLLSAMNLIFDSKYKLSPKKIKTINDHLKKEYNIIIFDTSAESFLDYTREIINLSDQVIFISGANLLEIKKSKRLLEIYTQEWGVNKRKINIVFNKCTNKSIDESVLKEVFNKYNILGKIELNEYYDLLINKNMSQKSKLHKEIERIKKHIIKEKYYGVS